MSQAERIVLIMTDTQRWDMLGCAGTPGMITPQLDRMAAEGTRFDRAYTCQPVCGPARSALFTGTWPHSNGSWANCLPLGANIRTVGERMAGHGFHTAYMGKWHLDGGDYFGTGRCPPGWDPAWWYDMRNYLEELTPDERRQSRRPPSQWQRDIPESFTFGHRLSTRAIDFLGRHGSERFLLVVSFDEPHGPFLCPKKYLDMYRDYQFPRRHNVFDSLADKPESHRLWSAQARGGCPASEVPIGWADYFACNTFVDDQIGRVLDAIRRLAPDALVLYTSDHGDAMQSHGLTNKGPAMYDEIARVPFFVRWPGEVPAGRVCEHPASHIDVVPTILDAAGLPVPEALEGHSMLPALRDPAARTNDAVFVEFGRYEVDHDGFGGFQPVRAVFDGRFKLVVNLLTTDEFYDLQADPDELANRIDDAACAAERDRLHDRLLAWMNETRDPFRGYYWGRRPWRRDASAASWGCDGMTRQRGDDPGYEPRQFDYDTGLEMTERVRRK